MIKLIYGASLLKSIHVMCHIYTIVWFLGRHAEISNRLQCRAKLVPYWLWQPPDALHKGRNTSVALEKNHVIIIITTWSHNVSSFYKLFPRGPVRGIDLFPDTVCKLRSCRQILSRLRVDLRENPTKQYHSDDNIATRPILKMYILRQMRIFNALNSDGYSTGNAPPSGNNEQCWLSIGPVLEI